MSEPVGTDLRIGYACSWWTPRAATWSYSANRLRDALAQRATITDIETQLPLPVRAGLAAVGRVTGTPWQYQRATRAVVDRLARRGSRRDSPDAVIEIADVDTPLAVPNFPYQDMSFALALAAARAGNEHVNLLNAPARRLDALAQRGTQRLAAASGVFTMSQWLADDVIRAGVPTERVHVVHAGLNSPPSAVRDPNRPPAGRLLFIGVDFRRKGGDAVLAAANALRAGGLDVRLSVAGPRTWPLPGEPPPWVDFLGPLAPAQVAALWARHDVFVMPSRFEAYGIVLVEALAAGLPCVAHDAYAMPELVRQHETGVLVPAVAAEPVAEAIAQILADPGYFARTAAARAELADRHSWPGVADRMVRHLAATLR